MYIRYDVYENRNSTNKLTSHHCQFIKIAVAQRTTLKHLRVFHRRIAISALTLLRSSRDLREVLLPALLKICIDGRVYARVDCRTAYPFEKENCLKHLSAFFREAISGTCPIDETTQRIIEVVLRLALKLLGSHSEIANARFRFDGDEVKEEEI
ncbi:hypothetical protein PRIPAC_95679 [Pristionchus pacificus]|uniref:Uncharacterized protein n=1 Tax=Pristionchus pacificus TaxID=54126 RepID=A0A2A6BJM8_PRIPA|nr:hypothetical protein PRIPAC_95679 [Pristionchus pacificus]|eukprot:PDM66026.1 hypothetical protein PRIPAC_44120 [Pristionchus pacificus]